MAPPVGLPLHLAAAAGGHPGEALLERGRVVGRDRHGPVAVGPADRQVPGRGLVQGQGAGELVAGPSVQLHGRREQGGDGGAALVDLGQVRPEQLGRDPRPRCSAPTERPESWLAGTRRPPQRTGWPRASSRPSLVPPSSRTRSSSTRVRATDRSILLLVVESPNAWASWTIRARCSSGRARRYLRVTQQPPQCPPRPYQPTATWRAESVTAGERPGNLLATPLLYQLGVPVRTPTQKGVPPWIPAIPRSF